MEDKGGTSAFQFILFDIVSPQRSKWEEVDDSCNEKCKFSHFSRWKEHSNELRNGVFPPLLAFLQSHSVMDSGVRRWKHHRAAKDILVIEENQAGTTAAASEEYERHINHLIAWPKASAATRAFFFIISVPAQKTTTRQKKYTFFLEILNHHSSNKGCFCMQIGSFVKIVCLRIPKIGQQSLKTKNCTLFLRRRVLLQTTAGTIDDYQNVGGRGGVIILTLPVAAFCAIF